jgi:hypothetical protein
MEFSLTSEKPVRTRSNSLEAWRTEIASYYLEMEGFSECDIADIFMKLAGMTARVSGIRSQIVQVENRTLTAFRTREIDPFIAEAERQFKVWSRLQSVKEMDFRISGGAT